MTGLLAYLVVVVAVSALACGHHGEDWPLRRTRRQKPPEAPRAPSWANTPIERR